jgi:hypothetical protein
MHQFQASYQRKNELILFVPIGAFLHIRSGHAHFQSTKKYWSGVGSFHGTGYAIRSGGGDTHDHDSEYFEFFRSVRDNSNADGISIKWRSDHHRSGEFLRCERNFLR